MTVPQIGGSAGNLVAVFVPGAEIGMRPEIRVLLPLGRYKAIAPQQNILGEIGEFGASDRVDKITRSSDGEVEAELLAGRCRHDPVVLGPSRQPRGGEMETEIRKSHHPLDGIGGAGLGHSSLTYQPVPSLRTSALALGRGRTQPDGHTAAPQRPGAPPALTH